MPKVTEAYLEARREEILDAAIACFTRKGFHQTTMEDIFREAELSAGAVYRYFAGKEEIIEAAVRKGPGLDVAHWIEEEVARFNDFRKFIERFNRIYYQQRIDRGASTEMAMKLRLRAWAEALQNPEARGEVLKRWEISLGMIEQMVRRAQELEQINPDLDPAARLPCNSGCHRWVHAPMGD